MVELDFHGETLALRGDATAYWHAQATLVVADTHFGKAAAFRAGGVPVPERTTRHDLDRLSRALNDTGALRLIVLGDLLHARAGRTREVCQAVADWRLTHADVEIVLVRGNHDRNAGEPPASWNVAIVDGPAPMDGLTIAHEPPTTRGELTLCGHLHPAVVLEDRVTRSRARLKCFWHDASCEALVFPAFGSFTGAVPVVARRGDRVVVLAEGEAALVGG